MSVSPSSTSSGSAVNWVTPPSLENEWAIFEAPDPRLLKCTVKQGHRLDVVAINAILVRLTQFAKKYTDINAGYVLIFDISA
jgi:hypothetical protein